MKSWKTSLVGLLAGIAVFVGGAVQQRQSDPTAPPVTAGNLLPAIAIAALGVLAKDYDKTNSPTPSDTKKAE